jgi:hypothetical protein
MTMFQRLDAAIESGNGKGYLFRGDSYARYDTASYGVEKNWPVKVAKEWDMTQTDDLAKWSAHFDTALNTDTGKVYFFKGAEYIRYDIYADRADDEWPKRIVDEWNGMPSKWFSDGKTARVDAALNYWNGKVYLFRDDEYVRYDLASDSVEQGWPKSIATHWPGVWPSGIDAAVNLGDGLIYFFRGGEYVRFHIRDKRALAPPQPIPTDFADLGALGGGARGVAWGEKVPAAFKLKVIAICQRLKVEPSYLMAAMAFETGKSFNPSIRNQQSGATGLIQFMEPTAKGLGTTTAKLAAMSAVDQLDYVERYFAPFTGRLWTLGDVYMAILYPAAVGQPADYALFTKPGKKYTQNAGLDKNGDGVVTKMEAEARVRELLAEGLLRAG